MPATAASSMRANEFPTDVLTFSDLDDSTILASVELEQLKLQQCDPLLMIEDFPVPFPVSTNTTQMFLQQNGMDVFSMPMTPGEVSPGRPQDRMSPKLSTSPGGNGGSKPVKIPRHKRESHINAEHRRRCKIQKGFDEIRKLVPAVGETFNSGGKDSKSAMLTKTIDFCRQLRHESRDLEREAEQLRQEAEQLNREINQYQQALPEAGVEFPRVSKPVELDKMFEDYIRARTLQNWKFYIFAMIARPLFESYKKVVNTTSVDTLCRSVAVWVEQHCSLVSLRPAVLAALRYLSTATSIMGSPEQLPEEALQAAMNEIMYPGTPV